MVTAFVAADVEHFAFSVNLLRLYDVSMQFPLFPSHAAVFLETTKSDHMHGGPGWEFGTCLWSPVRNAGGAAAYRVMEEPKTGDLILHNYHHSLGGGTVRPYLTGYSVVAAPARKVTNEPPESGAWAGRGEYYRIDLQNFRPFDEPLDFRTYASNYAEKLRDEIEHYSPRFYPFTVTGEQVRLNQGMYLTRVSELLYETIRDAMGVHESPLEPKEKEFLHRSYAEGERHRRETTFFVRHPQLVRDARKFYGSKCQVCGFDPKRLFGRRHEYTSLECHHLNPLSGRSEISQTRLEDVAIVCSNCHRLLHTRRLKPLSLEEARSVFRNTQLLPESRTDGRNG